jgi:Tol biopolymer transport system component
MILGFYADPNFALIQEKSGLLMRYSIATGEKTAVLEAGAGKFSEPALSPDDRWLAFVLNKPDGRAAMYIAPVAGGPAPERDWILLFNEERYLGSPAWSPDGTYLYYLSERKGTCSVWAQKLDAKSKRPHGPSRVVFRPQDRIDLNFPPGNGTVAVAKDKLALWVGEGTGNIYLASPKKK